MTLLKFSDNTKLEIQQKYSQIISNQFEVVYTRIYLFDPDSQGGGMNLHTQSGTTIYGTVTVAYSISNIMSFNTGISVITYSTSCLFSFNTLYRYF